MAPDDASDPHDRPYRSEDFRSVQRRPMSTLEIFLRRMGVVAGVTAVMVLAAFCARLAG